MFFRGIQAPAGKGVVLEVHADLIQPGAGLLQELGDLGLEQDPFQNFYPKGYTHHFTGRLRVGKSQLKSTLDAVVPCLGSLVETWGQREEFYFELELVRNTRHFALGDRGDLGGQLDNFVFADTGLQGKAKADVHVEFAAGTVLPEVQQYLESKLFYWVATPLTVHFGPEEIATLQTVEFNQGQQIYEALSRYPLPFCTAVHLEQKLGMFSSKPDLLMPEVITVSKKAGKR
jgi:hypothetical protein